jgi:hypothetical protein
MTRERELYDAIKNAVTNNTHAVDFVKSLAKAAPIYAGLGNPIVLNRVEVAMSFVDLAQREPAVICVRPVCPRMVEETLNIRMS